MKARWQVTLFPFFPELLLWLPCFPKLFIAKAEGFCVWVFFFVVAGYTSTDAFNDFGIGREWLRPCHAVG